MVAMAVGNVYWPRQECKKSGWIRGTCVDAQTYCVLAVGNDEDDDDLDVLGECRVQGDKTTTSTRKKAKSVTAPWHLIASFPNSQTLCPTITLQPTTSAINTSVHVNVILYDPSFASSGFLSYHMDRIRRNACFYPALTTIAAHSTPTSSTTRPANRMQSVVYYGILVPFLLVATMLEWFRHHVFQLRIPTRVPVVGGKTLCDFSLVMSVLDVQLANFTLVVRQVAQLCQSNDLIVTKSQVTQVLELVDTVIYLILDVLVGHVVTVYLVPQLLPLLQPLDLSPQWFFNVLRSHVTWLMGAPAGFKLNVPLASILGNGILLWLDFWHFCFDSIVILPSSLVFPSLSLQCALLSDLMTISTWHSRWVFLYFTKLNLLQFGFFSSLWRLFVGQKNNVLRHRVDSCEYDVRQLLLGTLLFTILMFLVTTNSVFFVCFGVVRLGIWLLQLLLWLPIVGLRLVPVGMLGWRCIRPWSFVDRFELRHVPSDSKSVWVEIVPVFTSFGSLLIRWQLYRNAIQAQYTIRQMIQASFFGQRMTVIPIAKVLQYTTEESG